MENSKAITNHGSSYPLRKWAVRSHWTHRSGDTTTLFPSLFLPSRFLAVGYSIPWIRPFDFFVSFTAGRDTGCMEGRTARHRCRTGEIGWVAGHGGRENSIEPGIGKRGREGARVCLTIACALAEDNSRVSSGGSTAATVDTRYEPPIPCFVFFFIPFISPRGNFVVTDQPMFLLIFPLGSIRKPENLVLFRIRSDWWGTFNNSIAIFVFESKREIFIVRIEVNLTSLFICVACLSRTNWTEFERSFSLLGLIKLYKLRGEERSFHQVSILARASFFSTPFNRLSGGLSRSRAFARDDTCRIDASAKRGWNDRRKRVDGIGSPF